MSNFRSEPTRWRRRASGTLAATAMIAAGFVALAGPASAAGTTIFVNPGGADATNCGTSVLNCKTIQAGIDRAEPGDTVQVAAGIYNEIVTITEGITVQGAGAGTTTIDGAGLNPTDSLVNITQPGGDVTFTGFTVKNQVAPGGDNFDSYAIGIRDANAADTITVSDNTFPGVSPAREGERPYGVNSYNGTAANQVFTDNKFSGLWRGLLIEGNTGPVDISDNSFEELIPGTIGTLIYPPKAVYFLADGNTGASDQNITGNTFRDYGGIGVSVRAGYDLGGCDDRTCNGTFAGTATGNTFDLDDVPSTYVSAQNHKPAAFNLQTLSSSDTIDLTLGGNTGVVPAQPIIEIPGPGAITLKAGSTANTIVPTPAPTVAVTVPSAIVAGAAAQEGSVSVKNTGDELSNIRYDVTITGTKAIPASQVKLQYDADPTASVNYQDVTLTGTANASGGITGYLGAAAGATLASSADSVVTGLRLSVPGASTTPDTLKTTIKLDQVSSGTGNPVIDTLATSNVGSTVVSAPAPAPVNTVSPVLGTLAKAYAQQTVTITVVNSDGTKPSNLEVDVLVSGATVANGTVFTNTNGVATFTFTAQHKGTFTVKAIAGGKSASVSGITPIRNVSTSVGLASPAKGTIKAVAYTSPKAVGAIIAFYFVQNGKYVFFHNAKADANGIATITAAGRVSGGTYSMAARVVNDPDTDSVYSPTKTIKIR